MTNEAVDVAEKLSLFSEHWSPKVVARLNNYEIKVVKFKGEFVWHTHEDTDELFIVIAGELTIQLREGDVRLSAGQLFVVPGGVEHCPVADGEVHALLVEPTGVINTGDAGGALTAAYDDSLASPAAVAGVPSPIPSGELASTDQVPGTPSQEGKAPCRRSPAAKRAASNGTSMLRLTAGTATATATATATDSMNEL